MKDIFEGLMLEAETKMKADVEKNYYWRGYIRGLRRAHYGEAFGTAADHTLWSQMVNDPDVDWQQMGFGYRDGLAALDKS